MPALFTGGHPMAYRGLDLDREGRCLAVAEAIEQRLGPLTPIDPVTG
jgi:hypothetical protein